MKPSTLCLVSQSSLHNSGPPTAAWSNGATEALFQSHSERQDRHVASTAGNVSSSSFSKTATSFAPVLELLEKI